MHRNSIIDLSLIDQTKKSVFEDLMFERQKDRIPSNIYWGDSLRDDEKVYLTHKAFNQSNSTKIIDEASLINKNRERFERILFNKGEEALYARVKPAKVMLDKRYSSLPRIIDPNYFEKN